ncbi:MAG: FAD-containing monooxygenase EthA, partial [Alphaproteobacteria bacterium HGW-Alphaproteobacteria-12]
MAFFKYCRAKPEKAKQMILQGVREQLGPDFDVKTHFTPNYNPWDQRLCLVPNGDLFDVIKEGRASVVTDHIDTFTEKGILLKSGKEIEADVIVTATGLNLKVLGGLQLSVDGRQVDLSDTMSYKGMMYSDVPNLASAFGYTNASWTLKCDLTCEYVCRLINHMDATGTRQATPRLKDGTVEEEPWLDFTSGYVQRSLDKFPKQGSKKPWKLYQNYALDIMAMKFGNVDDGVMEFTKPSAPARREPERLAS